VPHIERLVSGLGRALKASCLVLAVLAFFNFLLAIITCHFFRNLCPDLFGDPFVSMYSMFQVFTVEGWNEIPAEIKQNVQSESLETNWLSGDALVVISRIYFATTMLFGGIFGLSLANAVFVDEMTIDNTDDLEAKVDRLSGQIEELRAVLAGRQTPQ
jgi:voltage-gated sodium channel